MMSVFSFNSFYSLFVILLWSQSAGLDIFGMFPCTEEYMRLSFSLDPCWMSYKQCHLVYLYSYIPYHCLILWCLAVLGNHIHVSR